MSHLDVLKLDVMEESWFDCETTHSLANIPSITSYHYYYITSYFYSAWSQTSGWNNHSYRPLVTIKQNAGLRRSQLEATSIFYTVLWIVCTEAWAWQRSDKATLEASKIIFYTSNACSVFYKNKRDSRSKSKICLLWLYNLINTQPHVFTLWKRKLIDVRWEQNQCIQTPWLHR